MIITMKKVFIFAMMALAFTAVQAQDTYTNDRITNTSDIHGTARYVGMGGAMGALGGDISVIPNNPAGIGLFHRNDISIGMGAVIQDAKPIDGDAKAHYSFDQIGFVAAFNNDNGNNINFGVNLQKKLDFRHSMIAENGKLGGLSQAAQLAGLMMDFGEDYSQNVGSLVNQAYGAGIYDVFAGDGGQLQYLSKANSFYRTSSGNLYGLDLNVSGGVQDRIFWGATFGINFLKYRSNTSYVEFRDAYYNNQFLSSYEVQDYTLDAQHDVNGTGFNIKAGTIIRPIEDSPFRFGIAIETPSWYTLKQEDSYFTFYTKWQNNGWNAEANSYDYTYNFDQGQYQQYDSPDANYLEFNIHSPWKFRLSLASTFGDYLAMDVEYEYSLNNRATMGYPRQESSGWDDQSVGMDGDKAMNALTQKTINGVHNFRAGVEYKPVPKFAVRAGYNCYNLFRGTMKSDGRFDQTIDSYSMNFVTGTDYMNLKAANIFSFGMGYRGKSFYADVAYKYRRQRGDFYAFDDIYQTAKAPEAQFLTDASHLAPTDVKLDRHNVTFTLGFKF